jgi:hypothetical protein
MILLRSGWSWVGRSPGRPFYLFLVFLGLTLVEPPPLLPVTVLLGPLCLGELTSPPYPPPLGQMVHILSFDPGKRNLGVCLYDSGAPGDLGHPVDGAVFTLGPDGGTDRDAIAALAELSRRLPLRNWISRADGGRHLYPFFCSFPLTPSSLGSLPVSPSSYLQHLFWLLPLYPLVKAAVSQPPPPVRRSAYCPCVLAP